MSFFNSLFKAIKGTVNVNSTSLDHLNKGLDSINKNIDEAVKLKKLMSDAKVAYKVIIKLIDAADELSDSDLKLSKYPPEIIEGVNKKLNKLNKKLNKNMSESSIENFGLAIKTSWPVMRRPLTPDVLQQAKADNQYQEYLVELDQSYARIRKKCAGSAEYEKCLKKRLISMGCPYFILTKLCPSAKL